MKKVRKKMNKELQKIIEEVKNHPKVVAIYLFGSYARGEEKPLSDIDIAVILKDPDKKDEADIGSLYSEKIDLVLFHRLPLHIQYEVFKYGKELFVRDEDYLLELKLAVLRKYLEYSRVYNYMQSEVLRGSKR
ncbi:MAG TPA: nucleotidyltransferase domain-containing protein [Aquificaceae bacterium]|uniref:Nucleotidyltransferase domain-containing protein n=1 Tax=Hydrogenobacter sp. TaxID=2152829 RepID=A0A7C2V4F0_9AQUI|nr:nucleotidyltransferase domain-containing protein [Aquificaceae bacterium]